VIDEPTFTGCTSGPPDRRLEMRDEKGFDFKS